MEEDGTIKLQYVACDVKQNALPYETYKIHTTTISPTLPGDTMRDASDDIDIKWFAETNGIPVNKSETYTRLGTDWATFLLQEGIGNLPVVGGVIDTSTAIIEQIGDSTDILDSAKTYEQMTNIAQTRQMADNYKLNTIRVTHEVGEESSLSYYVFEGIGDAKNTETTRQIIDNVNRNLSPGGDYEEYAKDIGYDSNNPITSEDILANPEKVMDLQKEWLGKCVNGKKGVGTLGSAALYE